MTKSLCTIGTVFLMVASGFAADTVKVEATTNGASVIPAVTNNSAINIPVPGTQTSASALTTNSSTPLPTPEQTATPVTPPSSSTTQSPTPSSTTTHSPSSSSTTPSPVPKAGSWSVVGQNNATCVKFDGIIEIDVPYHNATEDLNLQTIYVPSTANATGQCGSNNQSISLSWLGNHVDIHFSKDESKREFELSSILVNISAIHFPDLNKNFTGPAIFYSNFSKVLSTTLDMSYSCTSVKGLILNDVGSEERAIFNNASVSFSSLHYQAFISKNNNFGEAYRCEADAVTPDIVPIVVGCALALLVIVVLVAYLIGRRRSQSHGYLSM